MKKKVISIISLFWLVLLACNTETNKVEAEKRDSPINKAPLTSLLVPDSIAETDILFFDSVNKVLKTPIIKAYTIRAEELLAAMGIDSNLVKGKVGYNHIRVYPAFREGVGFKLYIYPVEGADLALGKGGYDMVFDKNGKIAGKKKKRTMLGSTDEGDGYGMDLNAPCPHLCREGDGKNL
jgi:hypothetical protein